MYSSYALNAVSGASIASLGLSFSTTTGAITGTPSASGTSTFTVSVTDNASHTATSAQVTLTVASANATPTLSTISTLTGATEDTTFPIPYATLLAASNYADTDSGDPKSFRVEAVSTGTLYTNAGLTTQVTTGSTLLSTGGTWYWVPAANANGSALNAFTVKAWDGTAASTTAIQVKVDVTAVNDVPTFTGGANTGLTVLEDAAITTITTAKLQVTDVEQATSALTYTVGTAPTKGTLSKSGVTVSASGTFTQADIDSNLIKYTPSANLNGSDSFTFSVSDGAGGTLSAQTFNITITAVNDAPTFTGGANAGLTVLEDAAITTITTAMLQVTDIEQAATALTYTVGTAPTKGVLKNNGTTISASGTFTQANIDSGLITYTPTANLNGADSFTFSVSDGASGTLAGQTFNITITAANDAPTASGSATLTAVAEDVSAPSGATVTTLFSGNFSDATDGGAGSLIGVAISSYTPDAAKGEWQYQVNGTGAWTALGSATTATAITLASTDLLRFVPAANYSGAATALSVNLIKNGAAAITSGATINLTGATGAGTYYSSGTVSLSNTVNTVADTPSITSASTTPSTQTSSGLVISRNAADGAEVTHFKITAITNGTLYQNDGTTAINNGDFITYLQGNAGLKFTPSGLSDGSFVIQASTSNADGGLGGSTVTANITVGVAVASPTINEDTDSGAIAINGATNNYKITAISGGTLYSDNTYSTVINSGDFIATAGATTNVYFRPTANFNGAAGFSVQGSSSTSNADLTGNTAVSTITVTAIADTPTVASPTINENADSGAIAITRSASDGAETTRYQITAITGGTLYSDAGYTTQITNNAYVTSGGASTNVYFRPTANRNTTTGGNASFTVQAASASAVGGSTVTSTIILTPIAATPTAGSPTITEDVDSGAIVITRSATDGAEITYYKITGISGGTLYSDAGFTTPITNGSFIASGGATTNVYFRPTANSTTAGSFTVQASTSNADGGLGGSTATSTVGITPVADTPTVTSASTTPSTQTTSGLVISRNAADGAEVTHFKITAISNGSLFKNNGTTAINNGDFITYAEGQAGLKFTPSGSTDGSFAIQGATSNVGAGLSGTVTATVTVGVAVVSPTINEDTDSGAIAISGGTNNYKITAISGGTLYSDAGYTTAITSGGFIATAGATTNVYFRPTTNFNGAAGFSVQGSSSASGAGLTGNTAVSTITVTAVKDAPTGLGNLTLAAVDQGVTSPAGAAISALTGLNFTFVDSGSTLGGVAVIGNLANATTQGAWQYSTNAGTNWYDIGAVADDATALALSAATLVRFMPLASYSGTPPVLTVRALDNTYVAGYSVAAGAETRVTLDASVNGGTTAIAASTNTIGTTVSAPPASSGGGTTSTGTILPTGGGAATLTAGQSVTVTENGMDGTTINLPPPSTGTSGSGSNTVNVTLPGTGTVGVSSSSSGTQLGVTHVTLPGATTAVSTVTVDQGSASFTATQSGQAVAGLKNGIIVVSGSDSSKVTIDTSGGAPKIGVATSDTIIVPKGTQNVSGTVVDLPAPPTGGSAAAVTVKAGDQTVTVTSTQGNTTMTFQVVDIGGVKTPVLAITGAATVGASADNQPLVSVGGSVIRSGNSQAGSGGQKCNTIIQASSDASSDVVHVVTCYIVLPAGTFSALSGGNIFAAIKDGIVWAGETAEFDKAGIVTGAYLGTKVGTSDAVGDDIVPGNGKFTASGYTTNAFIPRLAGNPLRLNGAKLDESLFTTVNRVLGTTTLPATPSQSAQGILTFQVGGDAGAAQKAQAALTFDLAGDLVSVFPSRRIRVDTSRADGISVSTEGNVEVASGGLVTTFVPSVADPQGFAADLAKALPGSVSQMRWNGSWQVTASDGTTYVGRPQWGIQSAAGGAATFAGTGEGNLRYTANGRSQLLFPDFYDYTTLQATFSKEFNDAALKVQPRMNGTAQATVLGKAYLLAPQWNLVKPTTPKAAWWLDGNVVYFTNADGTAQGFTVR